MGVTSLWVHGFRCFSHAVLEPDPEGLTVLQGPNGSGKTSLLEALGWLCTQRSFRGAAREALVRNGDERAVMRCDLSQRGRRVELEGEIPLFGAPRIQVNRQVVRHRSALAEAVRATVFSPDDLQLVQAGPSSRRDFLDDLLAASSRGDDMLLNELDRVLRQRGALLRQVAGKLKSDVESTVDVWDSRLATVGEQVAARREDLVQRLQPLVASAYEGLSAGGASVALGYRRSWQGPLGAALERSRPDDLRRQVSTVGPHRDDLDLLIDGRSSRSQASQGEQRSLALALRLAAHGLVGSDTGQPPLLLLDDVFSELDPTRCQALVRLLPPGQVLLSTASAPPASVSVDRVVVVSEGRLQPLGRAS